MNETLKQSFAQQQYTFTVGNITIDGVTLVDKEYNVIQLPKSLLPTGTGPGSIIHLKIRRDVQLEAQEEAKINDLIEKLQTGEKVGDNIIGSEEDLENSSKREKSKQTEKKITETKPKTNSINKAQEVKAELKTQQKPESGMKKKPKIQQPNEQKSTVIAKPLPESENKQKPSVRQKSATRRTSSAMKKIKPQSNQTS